MANHPGTDQMPYFMRIQHQFSGHIRNPENQPQPEGIDDQRMGIYRDLFYNNIENFIASGFPVLRSIYSELHWHSMVRDFFIRHHCETPYFLKIAEEFLGYLQHEHEPQQQDPAGLLELAHYEWVELALSITDNQIDSSRINPDGDLLTGHPVLSPVAWPLAYHFPVHKMSRDYLPAEAPEQLTFLLLYRDTLDEIHFMEINAVTAHLLDQLEARPAATGYEILQQIALTLNSRNPETVIEAGLSSLLELQSRGIILGTQRLPGQQVKINHENIHKNKFKKI